MVVDYNNFAKTFSTSRKDMKWEEIDYFIDFINLENSGRNGVSSLELLDIGCGNGRLLKFLKNSSLASFLKGKGKYLGIDLSEGLLEEAKKDHSENDFLKLNMLDLDKIDKKFDYIFFIASFHHLDKLEDREKVLKKAKDLLKTGGKIFMTNWALNSSLNKEKYKNSIIKNSTNKFGGLDYSIKIGKYTRFYHCFSLEELDYLFKKINLKVIENRLFDNERNYISILQKNGD